MLSYLGADNRVSLCHTINLFDNIGTGQTFLIIFQRESFLQILDMCYPRIMILLIKQRIQAFQHFFHISDDTCTRNNIFINLSRIHIDLQHFCMLCKFGCISEYTVTETGTYRDQEITVCHTQVRIFGSVHTQHTSIQCMSSRKCAFAHQGITYRCMNLLGKLQKFCTGICCDRTAAYEDHRLFCLANQSCCLFQISVGDTCRIRKNHIRNFLNILCLIGSCIFRDIYQYRSRTSALCNTERTTHHFCQVSCIFNNEVMFGDRHGNAGDIHLLETVFSKKRGSYVTGNGYNRNRIHVGRCNTGDQVGGSRTGSRNTYAYFSGCSRIAVRCMGCPLFVGSQYMSDLITVFI